MTLGATQTDRPGEDRIGQQGPSVAVVLPASGRQESLEPALRRLLPACRDLGIEVCVIWPQGAGPVHRTLVRDGRITFLASPGGTAADMRAMAARELSADILIFTDEDRAALEDWGDSLMYRSGLFIRRTSGEIDVDWLARFESEGVSDPGRMARGA